MPPSPASFLMSHLGAALNLVVCLVIIGFNLAFIGALSKACEDAAGQKRWPVIPWLFRRWTWAWVFWLLIYVLKLVACWHHWDAEAVRGVLFVLSDLNSVCLITMTVALSRGASVDVHYYRAVTLLLLFAIVVWDGFLWVCGLALSEGAAPGMFLQVWSAALSVTSPLILGRLFVQRYATQSIWWIGLCYGLMQVFGYGAVLLPDDRAATIETPQQVTFAPDSRGFVRAEEIKPGQYRYVLRRTDGQREITDKIARQLLDAFEGHLDALVWTRAYLRLRVDDILFAILALLKLILGAQMLATVRVAPADLEVVVRTCERPAGPPLVRRWKAFYWPLIALSLILATVLVGLYGISIVVMLTGVAAPLSAALALTRKGRSLVSRFVNDQRAFWRLPPGEHDPDDDEP